MTKWKPFDGNKDKWNRIVQLHNGDYRQLWEWGDYKSSKKWKVLRLINESEENQNDVEIAQILFRSFWPICFVYIPGGVCNKYQTGFSKDIDKIFFKKFKLFATIIRVDSHYQVNDKIKDYLVRDKWNKPNYRNNFGLVSIINISDKNGIDILEHASSKWKYNYRRSLKNNLTFKFEDNPESERNSIVNVSKQMVEYKNVYHILNPSAILDISNFFSEDLLIVTCRNNSGDVIGFRAALCKDKFAWDLMAANNEEGRKLKSGYPLLVNLIDACKRRGANKYSLAGVTPGTSRSIFKIEAGGNIREFIGEYEKSNLFIFEWIFNYLLQAMQMKFSSKVYTLITSILKNR